MLDFNSITGKRFTGVFNKRFFDTGIIQPFFTGDSHEAPAVYAIICDNKSINDKNFIYIGSAKDAADRKIRHFGQLNSNGHFNDILQRSYNKRGGHNFKFIILEQASISNRFIREQAWLDFFRFHFGKKSVYNISDTTNAPPSLSGKDNGFFGKQHSEETKRKVVEANKRREWTPEYIKRIVEKRTGKEYIPKLPREKLEPKAFSIVNPDGEIKFFQNVVKFSLEYGLSHSKVRNVLHGRETQHKGYRRNEDKNIGVKFLFKEKNKKEISKPKVEKVFSFYNENNKFFILKRCDLVKYCSNKGFKIKSFIRSLSSGATYKNHGTNPSLIKTIQLYFDFWDEIRQNEISKIRSAAVSEANRNRVFKKSSLEKKRLYGLGDKNINQLKNMAQKIAKPYSFVSPTGETVSGTNILKFAKENGLDPSGLAKVTRGKVKQHKGWTAPKNLTP